MTQVYVGGALKPQSEWSAEELPPELASKVTRLPAPWDAAPRAPREITRRALQEQEARRAGRPRSQTSVRARVVEMVAEAVAPVTSLEIAAALACERGSVTSQCPALVREGLIQRRYIQPEDRSDVRRRTTQYLPPGLDWPPPPPGWRVWRAQGAQ